MTEQYEEFNQENEVFLIDTCKRKNKEFKVNNSEIIHQKKQFIFDVEQTSTHVFPNEVFKFYIYIKNISGVEIKNFRILIEHSSGIMFDQKDTEDFYRFDMNSNEVRLYEIKAYCPIIGEHIVHFIGFGEGTQVLYKTQKIKCTRTYNSEKLQHRISFYDFNPYEEKYSMEADNYSNEVIQTFKRQKLPYEAKKQPFNLKTDFVPENIESESFLEQYEEARNTQEHVYQYISRENFIEDSIESYTGENLLEIFNKINNESEYFNAKFLKSGTNHLLNDFMQSAPNGFIYRMGLLNSELYHTLGIIPSYTYMSDKLFRWAPEKNQLLSLIPEKKPMKWDQNIWAGKGWIIHKVITEEYLNTEECIEELKNKTIKSDEIVGTFEIKEDAEAFAEKLAESDRIQRIRENNDLIKFDYIILESIYDTGVFFVNIPVNKIPKNFFLINNDDLYAIINRVKPFGAKPVINYMIETIFDCKMEQTPIVNYHKKISFDMEMEMENESLTEYTFKNMTSDCGNGQSFDYVEYIPKNVYLYKNFNLNHSKEVDVTDIKVNYLIDEEIKQSSYMCETKAEYKLRELNDILDMLYEGNYNNISFKLPKKDYTLLNLENNDLEAFSVDEYNRLTLKNHPLDSIKLQIKKRNSFNKGKTKLNMIIKDVLNKKHRFEVKYDKDIGMDYITYSYINTNNQEYIREKGYQNILSFIICIKEIKGKKILLFLVEGTDGFLHYFSHVIVQDILEVEAKKIIDNQEESCLEDIYYTNNSFNRDIIFEIPYIKKSQTFQPKIIEGGQNWNNLYRLNDKDNSYSYINNLTNEYVPVNDISLFFNQINIPETAIINKLRLKVVGTSSPHNTIYVNKSYNTNHLIENSYKDKIQLTPEKIECYSHLKESSVFYENKLNIATKEGQDDFIEEFNRLLDENYIFNQDINLSTKYLDSPNDYIIIRKEHWNEISDFTNLTYNLNEVISINLIIEGYNTQGETDIFVETLSESDHSSSVKKKIPSGYFREKINLSFKNEFLLKLLRIRFRFDKLHHDIKIFDTKMELQFKNKQEKEIDFEYVEDFNINNKKIITIEEDYYKNFNNNLEETECSNIKINEIKNKRFVSPADLNNGTGIKLNFDDIKPGDYYHLNKMELEVIYTETDINLMVNNKKYQDIFYGFEKSFISGQATKDSYLSGMVYNDVPTMIQDEDNVGVDNRGIKLKDTLYQLFETRDDNITSIEIFPYGFVGNPDQTLKLGLYTNSYNTPGKLIKEVYIDGWVKNNDQLKGLGRIKYNINIENLDINEKYWFKLQVLNPDDNSYYLLKGINNTKSGFELLSDENNNYINTFSNLKFNIYSKNLSQTFNRIPSLQENFDNPYILIGLHKAGNIEKLQKNKYIKCSAGNDFMSKVFGNQVETEVFDIIVKEKGKEEYHLLDEEGE